MHTSDDASMIKITRVANGWILERSDEGEESPARRVYSDSGLSQEQPVNSLAQMISEAFQPYMQTDDHGGLHVSVSSAGFKAYE